MYRLLSISTPDFWKNPTAIYDRYQDRILALPNVTRVEELGPDVGDPKPSTYSKEEMVLWISQCLGLTDGSVELCIISHFSLREILEESEPGRVAVIRSGVSPCAFYDARMLSEWFRNPSATHILPNEPYAVFQASGVEVMSPAIRQSWQLIRRLIQDSNDDRAMLRDLVQPFELIANVPEDETHNFISSAGLGMIVDVTTRRGDQGLLKHLISIACRRSEYREVESKIYRELALICKRHNTVMGGGAMDDLQLMQCALQLDPQNERNHQLYLAFIDGHQNVEFIISPDIPFPPDLVAHFGEPVAVSEAVNEREAQGVSLKFSVSWKAYASFVIRSFPSNFLNFYNTAIRLRSDQTLDLGGRLRLFGRDFESLDQETLLLAVLALKPEFDPAYYQLATAKSDKDEFELLAPLQVLDSSANPPAVLDTDMSDSKSLNRLQLISLAYHYNPNNVDILMAFASEMERFGPSFACPVYKYNPEFGDAQMTPVRCYIKAVAQDSRSPALYMWARLMAPNLVVRLSLDGVHSMNVGPQELFSIAFPLFSGEQKFMSILARWLERFPEARVSIPFNVGDPGGGECHHVRGNLDILYLFQIATGFDNDKPYVNLAKCMGSEFQIEPEGPYAFLGMLGNDFFNQPVTEDRLYKEAFSRNPFNPDALEYLFKTGNFELPNSPLASYDYLMCSLTVHPYRPSLWQLLAKEIEDIDEVRAQGMPGREAFFEKVNRMMLPPGHTISSVSKEFALKMLLLLDPSSTYAMRELSCLNRGMRFLGAYEKVGDEFRFTVIPPHVLAREAVFHDRENPLNWLNYAWFCKHGAYCPEELRFSREITLQDDFVVHTPNALLCYQSALLCIDRLLGELEDGEERTASIKILKSECVYLMVLSVGVGQCVSWTMPNGDMVVKTDQEALLDAYALNRANPNIQFELARRSPQGRPILLPYPLPGTEISEIQPNDLMWRSLRFHNCMARHLFYYSPWLKVMIDRIP